jgi:spore cortex biosynthesis protein YabQ
MSFYGFILSLVFMIYQSFVHRYKIKKIMLHLSDLIFFIMTGLIGFILLLHINGGYLRFYVFIAIFSGFALPFMLKRNKG